MLEWGCVLPPLAYPWVKAPELAAGQQALDAFCSLTGDAYLSLVIDWYDLQDWAAVYMPKDITRRLPSRKHQKLCRDTEAELSVFVGRPGRQLQLGLYVVE